MAKKTKQEQLFPDPQVLDFRFRDQVLNPMLEAGWVEMTIPDKPTSSNQRYQITSAGKALLDEPS